MSSKKFSGVRASQTKHSLSGLYLARLRKKEDLCARKAMAGGEGADMTGPHRRFMLSIFTLMKCGVSKGFERERWDALRRMTFSDSWSKGVTLAIVWPDGIGRVSLSAVSPVMGSWFLQKLPSISHLQGLCAYEPEPCPPQSLPMISCCVTNDSKHSHSFERTSISQLPWVGNLSIASWSSTPYPSLHFIFLV